MIMPSMVEAKDIVINGGIFHQNNHLDSKLGMVVPLIDPFVIHIELSIHRPSQIP